jgi:hypothetical protein
MRGVEIILYERSISGTDEFNRPEYEEIPVIVENVLIGEPSAEDVINELNLSGKRIAYTLGIPKGDNHNWADRKVTFYGKTFRTIGEPTQGIDSLVPTAWNKKVKVERYEQQL